MSAAEVVWWRHAEERCTRLFATLDEADQFAHKLVEKGECGSATTHTTNDDSLSNALSGSTWRYDSYFKCVTPFANND